MNSKRMTVAEYKSKIGRHIDMMEDTAEIIFGDGDLSVSNARSKQRTAAGKIELFQIEFNEVYKIDQDFT